MTLRRLLRMAEARRQEAWDHTAELMATTLSAMGVGNRMWTGDELHPLRQKREVKPVAPPKVGIEVLKVFLPNK